MIMRKCHLMHVALLALCISMPTSSWALGLDEIDVTSALNERFAGTIELLDARGFQPTEVVVSMASREDFERVGVERFFYLTNLKFEVEMNGDTPKVKVSSSQPISEPYLNFIVEVFWPRGRLLKEYTVLLDPPTFSQAAAPTVAAPAQSTPAIAAAPARPRPSVESRPATQVNIGSTSRTSRPSVSSGERLMTTRDDTLWKIASRTRTSDQVSVNQQMLAIQRKNPNAFIRNNINLLKAGYALDLPSESEALSVQSQAATNDVAAQTDDWRSGADRQVVADGSATQLIDDTGAGQPLRSQIDASSDKPSQTASQKQSEGQVRIVANSGELASGTASGDDPSVNQLIEQNETLNRQVDELNYKLDREKEIATNEVTVKDRQLEVKNQELAAAQERMKELDRLLAESQKNQNQNANPEPVDTPFWQSPLVLFGVIGILILILAFALLSVRRSRNANESASYDYEPTEQSNESGLYIADTEPVVASEEYASAEDHAADDNSQVEPFIGDLTADDEGSEDEHNEFVGEIDDEIGGDIDDGQIQTGDVIGEAEIYIAYGRFGQAANLLIGVLDKESERWDVRLKLLEVYVESQDGASFATHAQFLLDNCDDDDVLHACRELESQLDSSDIALVDDNTSAPDSGTAADAPLELAEDSFELDLDELEPAVESNVSTDAEPILDLAEDKSPDGEADASTEEDLGIDFELEFDDAETNATDDGVASGADELSDLPSGDELGGDLGIEFDPDKDVVEEGSKTSAQGSSALDSADADLDDLLADVPGETSSEEDNADDFEFETSDEGDVNTTKLDLAEAYIDMGDADGAQDILREVVEEGAPEQKQKAQEMLDKL